MAEQAARDLGSVLPGVPGPLCVGHPAACQALSEAAEGAGARVVRGVGPVHLVSGLLVEAIRLTSDRDAVTGEEVKRGFESITDFTAYGLLPGTMITADTHAGSRKVRRYQVRNGKLALERDWFEGPRPI